jgi:hypothetical protein
MGRSGTMSDKVLSIGIYVVFLAICCTTATFSTLRRRRSGRRYRGDDPVNPWSPGGARPGHHGGGSHHHGGGSHHNGGWGGGGDGHHGGGWGGGGGDSGSPSGHHG